MKTSVNLNHYPSNYAEEDLPHIIVEIRYRGDTDPERWKNLEEAVAMATKLEVFMNEIL